MNKRLLIIYLFFLFVIIVSAQNSKLTGYITDQQSGEELIGVNIGIIGTYKGASTDGEGFYLITDLQEGEYTVEVTYIGYKVVQKTGVKIGKNKTVTLNFELQSTTLALGQDIVVIGKKPLLDIEETSTSRRLTSADIKKRIANDATDLVSQQVGVVKQDNTIYIRGGRSYEAQYLLDGISVQDPLSGTGFGLNISANAIEEVEVITGGFSAEYGQATSGIVKINTKSGSNKYEGYLSYKSDNLGVFRDQDFSFNSDQYELNLSGPEPFTNSFLPKLGIKLPGKIYFFVNFYSYLSDDYTRSTASQLRSSISPIDATTLAPRQNNNWSALLKLTWKINPTNTLTGSINRSLVINQNTQLLQTNLEFVEPNPGFPYSFSKNLDNFNTYTHDNEQVSLKWQHTVNSTTFFDLRFGRFFTRLRSDLAGKSWQDYTQPTDMPRLPIQYFYPDTQQVRVIPGDGFYDFGNSFIWHDHHVESFTFKGDLTSQINKIHRFKGGFEANFKEMQLIDIADPFIGNFGSSQDIYRVFPSDGAIYFQDDVKANGFILNAGLRLDWWAPGEFADRAVKDTTNFLSAAARQKYADESFDMLGRQVKLRLMPRIGISFPISSNQMLYFNYGHFSKRPRPQFVYAKLKPTESKSVFQKHGNPSLSPETSVKYEMGVRHKFTEDDVFSVTAFYKDIFDYVQTISANLGRFGQGIFYINRDYARSRGIELEYQTRIGKYIFGSMTGSVSLTTTKSSDADNSIAIADQNIETPIREVKASWDRPWKAGANFSINIPQNHNPEFLGMRVFSDWSMNIRLFVQAGKRYTPQVLFGTDPEGRPLYASVNDQSKQFSKVGTPWHWVNLNFTKNFRFFGLKYGLFLEIKNLFDYKSAQIINPVTGDAYKLGDDVPSGWNDPRYPDRSFPISSPFPLNPARYLAPRNIRFGASMEF
jgi:outer membrane receptor protein involved in Fe transport